MQTSSNPWTWKIHVPENTLQDMIQKAVENTNHNLLTNISRELGCSLDTLKGKQPFKYWSFIKLCRLAGFNENQVLAKCDVTRRDC